MELEQRDLDKPRVKVSEDFDFNDSENMIQFKIISYNFLDNSFLLPIYHNFLNDLEI